MGLWLASAGSCASSARIAAATPSSATASGPVSLDYTFTLDAALSMLSARVCMKGLAPASFVYGIEPAAAFIRNPRWDHAGQSVPLRVVDEHVRLDGVAADSCIAYEVDLDAAREHDSLLLAYAAPNALATSVELFLWRPTLRPQAMRSRARFVLPRGVEVSVPWARAADGDGYTLDERVFAFSGHAAFGHFTREALQLPGGHVEITVLDGFPPATQPLLVPWIRAAAEAVVRENGGFPTPFAHVLIVPTAASPRPIRFGHTGRGGEPSILLFLPTDADAASLHADWIALHELCHLLHPFVDRDDAWLSEGLATYLQEVLRTRAGFSSAAEAWRKINEGAQLGREAQASLAEETRMMHHANNYARVYWAGAAIALLIDVELRRRSHGEMTLDKVLAGLASCREAAVQPYAASALLAEMDRVAGGHEPSEIAARYLNAPRFPDLTALFAELGLGPDGQPVAPAGSNDAPLAWVRDAIMVDNAHR